jgi:hypothetical protein
MPTTKNVLFVSFVVFCLFIFSLAGYYIGRTPVLPPPVPTSRPVRIITTPVTAKPVPVINWKTFQNADVLFSVPSSWIEKPVLIRGSGYTQEFTDPGENPVLSFMSSGNYNQLTGKPYASVDDYLPASSRSRTVIFDGREGKQLLPLADGENLSSAVVLSPDSQFIYTLDLKTVDAASNQQIFARILTSFRFRTGALKTAYVFVQDGSYYGPPYDSNLYQLEIDRSHYLFAKSDQVDLKSYLGKQVIVRYHEVPGVIMGEQQLVTVDSIEL